MKFQNNNKTKDLKQKEVLAMYKNGKTLEIIAKKFKFTRSRAQQILKKAVANEILEEFNLDHLYLIGEEKRLLKIAVKEETKQIYEKRRKEEKKIEEGKKIERLNEKKLNLPDCSVFLTIGDFAKAMNEDVETLKKYLPDETKQIIYRRNSRWSKLYNKCRECGTTTAKHHSLGLCEKCYCSSDTFKEMQESSRIRNGDRWKKRQKAYLIEYNKRPEVQERVRKQHDTINFGGNREKALKRDKNICKRCGLTEFESLSKYKKKLFVSHKKSKNDNSLDNLITLCSGCFSKNRLTKWE